MCFSLVSIFVCFFVFQKKHTFIITEFELPCCLSGNIYSYIIYSIQKKKKKSKGKGQKQIGMTILDNYLIKQRVSRLTSSNNY